MNIGLYGSDSGLRPEQLGSIKKILKNLSPERIHRCNTYGSAYDFHHLVVGETSADMVVHSTYNNISGCNDRIAETVEHANNHVRDDELIKQCELLIIAVDSNKEKMTSPTWNFARKAKYANRDLIVVNLEGNPTRF